jgi:hypothetical protein
VIGAVAVRAGKLVPDSYQHNPNHRLLTSDGFFMLPTELYTFLYSDLRERCTRSRT